MIKILIKKSCKPRLQLKKLLRNQLLVQSRMYWLHSFCVLVNDCMQKKRVFKQSTFGNYSQVGMNQSLFESIVARCVGCYFWPWHCQWSAATLKIGWSSCSMSMYPVVQVLTNQTRHFEIQFTKFSTVAMIQMLCGISSFYRWAKKAKVFKQSTFGNYSQVGMNQSLFESIVARCVGCYFWPWHCQWSAATLKIGWSSCSMSMYPVVQVLTNQTHHFEIQFTKFSTVAMTQMLWGISSFYRWVKKAKANQRPKKCFREGKGLLKFRPVVAGNKQANIKQALRTKTCPKITMKRNHKYWRSFWSALAENLKMVSWLAPKRPMWQGFDVIP